MNVAFVYTLKDKYQTPSKPLSARDEIQFGISYISSFLKKHGHNTRLLILTKKTENEIIDEFFKEFKPALVCFTAVTSEYEFVSNSADYIKKNYPSTYLIIGGPYASLNPNGCVNDPFDAICIGEGEHPTLELVKQLQDGKKPSKIQNLWIKNNSKIEKNPTRAVLEDLDSLPFPDREMWREWTIGREVRPTILLGRGCPFQCTNCCNHALKKIASGRYVRFRSPENILEEVKDILAKFPTTKEIYFEVETIGVNQKWVIRLCSKLEEYNKGLTKPVSFGVNLRVTPNMELEKIFDALNKANFKYVRIGLESGSERVRREILKRNYSNQDIIDAARLAKEYGLGVTLYNMIGIPGETLADFKETIRINREILPDSYFLSIFFPYPGTDLHQVCKEKGLLDKIPDADLERCKATLDLPGFSKRQIQHNFIWFEYYVYKGHKPLSRILWTIFKLKIMSEHPLIYEKIFIPLRWVKRSFFR